MSRPAEPIVIVGSGASGVHFARTLLQKGYHVRMIDVGRSGAEPELPDTTFSGLKSTLDDPARFFLGESFQDLVFRNDSDGYNMRWPWSNRSQRTQPPDQSDALHGFGQHLANVFEPMPGYGMDSDGFAPVMSFARGGLAEAWAAGAFAFNESELQSFPFSFNELRPHYDAVAQSIGVSGESDDLDEFTPFHDHLQPSLELNEHAACLLDRYRTRRAVIRNRLNCVVGRSRVATLTQDLNGRRACNNLGRCMTGCPRASIYSPRFTLEVCQTFPNFEYIPGWLVNHFRVSQANEVESIVARKVGADEETEIPVGTLILAAGTLSTGRIMLESIRQNTGAIKKLHGLMDTRMLLVPFFTPSMLCKSPQLDHYQYHHLAIALNVPGFSEVAHGQITTMTGTAVHAAAQGLGFDLKTALYFFRHMRSALGVVMVALGDTRREENFLTLAAKSRANDSRLVARYVPDPFEGQKIRKTVRQIRKLLKQLGCIVPPGKTHIRPAGTGIHYAGTLPMAPSPESLQVDPNCRSADFSNLFIADGSTFPSLPGKGLTFSLMANAARVATEAF